MQPDNICCSNISRRKTKGYRSSSTWKIREVCKNYFLKADKENRCNVAVLHKVVNENDDLGMKVPSRLIFTAEEKYINILKERLPNILICYNKKYVLIHFIFFITP